MTYSVAQRSWPHAERKDYWGWEIWIEAPGAEMAQIAEVHYLLHATFPKPHRVMKDPEGGFRLRSAGWGEFNIVIIIVQADGTKIEMDHWLQLGEGGHLRGDAAGEKVFLTYAASDADAAAEAKAGLEEQGYAVATSDDLPFGVPWEVALRKLVNASDMMVAIVPQSKNRALERDLELAQELDKKVVPVVIETRGLRADLGDMKNKVDLEKADAFTAMVNHRLKR